MMNTSFRDTVCGGMAAALLGASAWMAPAIAHADAVGSLRSFVKDVHSGKGAFTQVVSSPDGKRRRKSEGSLEFKRPNQFRFAYRTPTEQLIVGDGQQVWLWDEDLNQVTVRPMGEALGATPAALLSGNSLDKDFTLKNVPATAGGASQESGWEWVEATPRSHEGQFRWVRVAFQSGVLKALEIQDSFGQRSRLDFPDFQSRVDLPPARFQFKPPAGADVLKQP